MAEESVIVEEKIAERPNLEVEDLKDGVVTDKDDLVLYGNDENSTEYQIGKNKFHRVNCSSKQDIVFGRYRLNVKKPLPEFNTQLAHAYECTDIKNNDSSSYYALTLDKRYPARLTAINKLLNKKIDNFTNIVAAQILPVSHIQGRAFVIIVEKPKGIKITDFLRSNGPINEEAIISRIIRPVVNVILLLEQEKLVHGRINADNLYIDSNGDITLGECISEPCGYSQPHIYENVSRASTIPIGKGRGIAGLVDYHALAVLAVICIRGKNPYEEVSDDLILELKYSKNTYRMITDGVDISPFMSDFLRGAINENIRQTWNNERMKEWLSGRRYNLLPPTENIDAGRPIIFNDKRFLSKKHLAYAMFQNWVLARQFIKESTLVRWIERSVQDTKLAEKMDILSNRFSPDDPDSSFDRSDELVAQYIMLLDPNGPIRLKQVSVNIDGIGTLLADALDKKNSQHLEAIKNIIKHSLVSYKEFDRTNIDIHTTEKDDALMLKRCTELYRKKYKGFGIERMLYELNPEIPCRSDLLKDKYVCVIPDMFEMLQDIKLSNENFDIHLVSFISAKLELPVKLRIKSLTKFPDFAAHDGIENLALLSVAQQTFRVKDVPKLTQNISDMLNESVETFHSKSIREQIRKDLESPIKKGNFTAILSAITDGKHIVKDRLGFRRAVIQYRNNTIQITKLNNKKAVNNIGYLYGLQLSVILTFFMATLVVIILIIKIF